MDSPYIYRKEGVTTWRLMTVEGKELSDFVIDDYSCGINSVWYQSGETCGYWQFNVIFLPPIYGNIEMPGDPEDPLLFTLNGVQGYVRFDGSFLPLSEFKQMKEEDEDNIEWDFICEQYDKYNSQVFFIALNSCYLSVHQFTNSPFKKPN